MKITIEMNEHQYKEMLEDKKLASKYKVINEKLDKIMDYPEVHPYSYVKDVTHNPYIKLSSGELYTFVLELYKGL